MAKAAQHKAKLVKSAVVLFRQKGYAATGINEILSKSGAPKGSLYYYFPAGKQALAAEAVAVAGKAASNTLLDIKSKVSDAAEFIDQYSTLLTGWMEESDFQSGCPIATTLLETCPTSAVIQQAGREVFENWIKIISDVFINDGREAERAREIAVVVIASLEGALILSRTLSSVKPIHTVAKQLKSL